MATKATNLELLERAGLIDARKLSDFEKEVVAAMSDQEVAVLVELQRRNSTKNLGQRVSKVEVPL